MAIVAYDNSAQSTQTNIATIVLSIGVAANACLLVGTYAANGISTSAVYANGTALTKLGRRLNDTGGQSVELWGITSIAAGNYSVSAPTVGGVNPTAYGILAASYTGAKTFGDVTGGTAGAVGLFTLTYSTSTTDRMVLFDCFLNTAHFENITQRQSNTDHRGGRWGDTAGSAATFIATVSGAAAGAGYAYIGVNIVASAAPTFTIGQMNLKGVGK